MNKRELAEIKSLARARRRSRGSRLDDPMATLLRNARPLRATLVTLKGENLEAEIKECEVPDLQKLEGVIYEGFDPLGIAGPTYYRVTSSHYYSTMFTQKGIQLAITELK
jgi:hypothetical protein